MGVEARKPHAVCVPCPIPSHIHAMLSLAKLLHHRGFRITFVNTDFNHRRLLRSRGAHALDGLPDFRFCSFPDGLPPADPDAIPPISVFLDALQNTFLPPFLHLLTTHLPHAIPPPTFILADIFMPFLLAAGEELRVPVISFASIGACGLMGNHQFRALRDRQGVEEDAHLDWVPGMKNIRVREVFNNFRNDEWDEAVVSNLIVGACEQASAKAAALIINTVEDLEGGALDGLASIYRRVYAVGPIHLLLDQIPPGSPVASLESNLWKEESECLRWLDRREPASVVYVNFGSLAVATPEQIADLATALAACSTSFLWVVRPDLQGRVPPEYREQTAERILVASWCPQEKVLRHPSVGAFLTHNGWNSTMESVGGGVPMICRPFFGDQHTNCRLMCREWEMGLEMGERMTREEVVRAVRGVMEGEEGRRMKERAMEIQNLAHKAADPKGSSAMNLEKVVNEAELWAGLWVN